MVLIGYKNFHRPKPDQAIGTSCLSNKNTEHPYINVLMIFEHQHTIFDRKIVNTLDFASTTRKKPTFEPFPMAILTKTNSFPPLNCFELHLKFFHACFVPILDNLMFTQQLYNSRQLYSDNLFIPPLSPM